MSKSKLTTLFGIVVAVLGIFAAPENAEVFGVRAGEIAAIVGAMIAAVGPAIGVPEAPPSE